jgi:S1-C subfamily serine protease
VAVVLVFALGKSEQAALRDQLVSLGAELATERGSRADLEQELQALDAQAGAWTEESATLKARSDSMRVALAQSQQATARQQRQLTQQQQQMERDRRFGPIVTDRYAGGVCLIEMVWGYRNRSGRWLRVRGSGDGDVEFTTDQRSPMYTSTGFGTGFLIEESGWILTNKHVSEPFADDRGITIGGEAYRPAWVTLRAYFPPGNKKYDAEVVTVSHEHDLGLMRTSARPSNVPVLPIATAGRPVPGDRLVLLGYPTGSTNIFWRADESQITAIQSAAQSAMERAIQDGGFGPFLQLWEAVADGRVEATEEQLEALRAIAMVVLTIANSAGYSAALEEAARLRLVQPHISSGEVTDTTRADIFHSAPMVGGASGGPVVGHDFAVISVNYAMNVEEDRGAVFQKNRSVPHDYVWRFLPDEVANRIRRR